jgi:hypothetical protein
MSRQALSRGAERGANRPADPSCSQMLADTAENPLALDPPSPPRDRDEELVRFVGRHGLVAIRHVMAELGVGRTAAYRRVGTCLDAGLLERVDLLRTEPGLLRATRDGLRYAGLGLPLAKVSPGTIKHLLRCTSTALRLGEHYGHDRVRSEREIVLAEQIAGKALASADLGERHGRTRLHRPDLAVLADQGTIAIEVELHPKAPRRLYALIRAWRWAIGQGPVSEVHYHCAPGQTRKAVERAVYKVKAEQFISIGQAVAL